MLDKSKDESDHKPSMEKNDQNQKHSEFEEFFDDWLSEMNDRMESIRESEVLTQDDLAIRINVPA